MLVLGTPPPATRTMPFGSSVAVSSWRAEAMDPVAAKVPVVGRVKLTPMLAASGRLMGDLTTIRVAPDRFLVFGSGYLQAWHMRWFAAHLPATGVTLRNLSNDWGGIAIFGPKSRDALARVTAEDVSHAAG